MGQVASRKPQDSRRRTGQPLVFCVYGTDSHRPYRRVFQIWTERSWYVMVHHSHIVSYPQTKKVDSKEERANIDSNCSAE